MSRYRRLYIPGNTWFFTVNLRDRRSLLLCRAIDLLRVQVARVKRRYPFTIDAWVVLPEHMHCIWTLPEGDNDYSLRWQEIKKGFTRALTPRRAADTVWQRRFWEHGIRDEKDFRRHMDYVYFNPVKHGWVRQVCEWPFSSFHRDVARGLYPKTWAGDSGEFNVGERCR
ncbi:transposase [Cronobacter turicensis]|uniref:Transposase n=2 Tax=Cronobacter turicensis TaxID=413502 RepID=A0A2T7B455_9ENTR|nr:transposase [Cronobacter turicensis]PUX21401.1 transposase [Cronobacter turicensis]PUX40923.1 transposase [Cronobacter turicensis]